MQRMHLHLSVLTRHRNHSEDTFMSRTKPGQDRKAKVMVRTTRKQLGHVSGNGRIEGTEQISVRMGIDEAQLGTWKMCIMGKMCMGKATVTHQLKAIKFRDAHCIVGTISTYMLLTHLILVTTA